MVTGDWYCVSLLPNPWPLSAFPRHQSLVTGYAFLLSLAFPFPIHYNNE